MYPCVLCYLSMCPGLSPRKRELQAGWEILKSLLPGRKPLTESWEEREASVFGSNTLEPPPCYAGNSKGRSALVPNTIDYCLLFKFSQIFTTGQFFICYPSLVPFPEALNGCILKIIFTSFTGEQVSGASLSGQNSISAFITALQRENNILIFGQVPPPCSSSKCLRYCWLFVLSHTF